MLRKLLHPLVKGQSSWQYCERAGSSWTFSSREIEINLHSVLCTVVQWFVHSVHLYSVGDSALYTCTVLVTVLCTLVQCWWLYCDDPGFRPTRAINSPGKREKRGEGKTSVPPWGAEVEWGGALYHPLSHSANLKSTMDWSLPQSLWYLSSPFECCKILQT